MNCQVFLDSWSGLNLSFVEDVPDVKADVLLGCLIQFRDQCLGEPDHSFFDTDLYPADTVIGLKELYLRRWNVLGTYLNNVLSTLRIQAHSGEHPPGPRFSPSFRPLP